MCEFNVILNGKIQLKDVIYAKVDGDNVTVKNILGEAKEFQGCKIVEVDVNLARLVLVSFKVVKLERHGLNCPFLVYILNSTS